jgi:phospholipase C
MKTHSRRARSGLALAAIVAVMLVPAAGSAKPNPLAKLNHILVLMQENRSFDHYLGHLKSYDPTLDVEAEPANASNPDPTKPGQIIPAYHETSYCEVSDLDHSWTGTHNEWDNGKMDGFTAANVVTKDPNGHRTMGYYTQADIPFYYSLYDTFAMGDRYFQSVLSQTFPNRFYLLAGTSFGHIRNDFPEPPSGDLVNDFKQPTIFNRLDAAGISWKIYFTEVPFGALFGYVRQHPQHLATIAQYYADAALGQLPQVSFVDPIFLGPVNVESDEHPPSNIQIGQFHTSQIVNALMRSPNWHDSALFLTYDEHGGFYDHVPPPSAPAPDSIPPMLQPGDTQAAFDRLGIRVPFAVVSPFAKRHFVSHVVHDHTSIIKTIELRFGLAPLTNRDGWAAPLTEMFNFNHPSFASPPTLAAATIDPAHALDCETKESPPTGF